jgi:catechol 2,3-dioxygenase-like lactoylglutathione lyase family enzyme
MPSPPPFSLVGLDHVVFLVDDMARAMRFYGEVLGCEPGYSYPALGMEQVWCGSALIVLWDTTHPGAAGAIPPVRGGRNVDHVCINLSPFDHDAMRAHLAAHGVAVERERARSRHHQRRQPVEDVGDDPPRLAHAVEVLRRVDTDAVPVQAAGQLLVQGRLSRGHRPRM